MNNFFAPILNVLDVVIIGLVLLSGFFQKRYFQGFHISVNESYDAALKTLILSFGVSLIYILLIKDPSKGLNWSKYFISYFFATSLYELLIEPFSRWVGQIGGDGKHEPDKPQK